MRRGVNEGNDELHLVDNDRLPIAIEQSHSLEPPGIRRSPCNDPVGDEKGSESRHPIRRLDVHTGLESPVRSRDERTLDTSHLHEIVHECLVLRLADCRPGVSRLIDETHSLHQDRGPGFKNRSSRGGNSGVDSERPLFHPQRAMNRVNADQISKSGIDHLTILKEEDPLAGRVIDRQSCGVPTNTVDLNYVDEREVFQITNKSHTRSFQERRTGA